MKMSTLFHSREETNVILAFLFTSLKMSPYTPFTASSNDLICSDIFNFPFFYVCSAIFLAFPYNIFILYSSLILENKTLPIA